MRKSPLWTCGVCFVTRERRFGSSSASGCLLWAAGLITGLPSHVYPSSDTDMSMLICSYLQLRGGRGCGLVGTKKER